MDRLLLTAAATAVLSVFSSDAQASVVTPVDVPIGTTPPATFYGTFPSASSVSSQSIVDEAFHFSESGQFVEERFANTGVFQAGFISLYITYRDRNLAEPMILTLTVNDVTAGEIVLSGSNSASGFVSESFALLPQSGDDYKLRLFVSADGCAGCGSIGLRVSGSEFILVGQEAVVAEPAVLSLLGFGVLGLMTARSRKYHSSQSA